MAQSCVINAFQNVLKSKYLNIGGLQSTLIQKITPLVLNEQVPLQIIHSRKSHWAALQIGNDDTICSAYTSAIHKTMQVIAQLIRTTSNCLKVQIMNTAKQTGSVDRVMLALATITHLCLGEDPLAVVFDQRELRAHLAACLEKGEVKAFPIIQQRRPANRVIKVEECAVYCHCRLLDDGSEMVCCDICQDWFHTKCV